MKTNIQRNILYLIAVLFGASSITYFATDNHSMGIVLAVMCVLMFRFIYKKVPKTSETDTENERSSERESEIED